MMAKKFGAPDPEETDGVKEARAVYNAIKDNATAESDVYDHLYRFFERYYDEGDFISRRYYTRESPDKAAPFAIPYNGEEVKLHWANADQYYIKTAEYFSNYTFDIIQASEIRKMSGEERLLNQVPDTTLKVHFQIVDATEGEHGNIKGTADQKRFFVLCEPDPVAMNASDELVVNFEYKPLLGGKNTVDADTEKVLKQIYGKSLRQGDMPNLAIAQKVIEVVETSDNLSAYANMLKLAAPTDKVPNRPLLAKYINQYTARNTCDYFIHKDLGGFLKRELDFYIKNEVMHLDDIENADAPAVESYLTKLKVIRKIAAKLIEFLAQLENFQKKLWLKKKFVVETNYCMTLDRVPQELYGQIVENPAQIKEWINLFAIDEIKGDGEELPGMRGTFFTDPPTVAFLKANDKLVLDTAFFSDEFKVRLIESIEDFDEQCDGLLIHSENFQALNLLQERYREQVKCVAVDPPYNTGLGDFPYKDNYQHSSWLAMMHNRLALSTKLLSENFVNFCCSGEDEQANLKLLFFLVFGEKNILPAAYWEKVYSSRMDALTLSEDHDHISIAGAGAGRIPFEQNNKQFSEIDPENGEKYRKRSARKEGSNSRREDRPNLYYEIISPDGTSVYPIKADGSEGCWRWAKENYLRKEKAGELEWVKTDVGWQLYAKQYLNESATRPPSSLWKHELAGHNHEATQIIKDLFGYKAFATPKPPRLFELMIRISSSMDQINILDYFAGSGTTGHAVINLNREDNGKRKYILVEMGDYFETVLKPRIQKVLFSAKWKNGKPTTRDTGISHCFKTLRLESYEDTLNNLEFDNNSDRDQVMAKNKELCEDYTLHYLLDVETRGSQSLLNIDNFAEPFDYTLKVKKPGSDEQVNRKVDLVESFNYLMGLRLVHMAAAQRFTAKFIRKPDPELPEDQHTKLVVDGKIELAQDGKWGFRKIEGWVPGDPVNPNNGQKEKVFIIWRNLTGNLEEDNLMLDEWFIKYRISARDFEYDTIYVNGSNNLPNLKKDNENWKVRLIEEEFHKKMWETE